MTTCEHGQLMDDMCNRCERVARRAPNTLMPTLLQAATDAELRAECERRGWPGYVDLRADRDEWKRRAIAAETDHDALRSDADEWRRRADTERQQREILECEIERRKTVEAAKNEMLADLRERLRAREAEAKELVRRHFRDEGHYVDPWDLLCEDAP